MRQDEDVRTNATSHHKVNNYIMRGCPCVASKTSSRNIETSTFSNNIPEIGVFSYRRSSLDSSVQANNKQTQSDCRVF